MAIREEDFTSFGGLMEPDGAEPQHGLDVAACIDFVYRSSLRIGNTHFFWYVANCY